MMDSLWQDLRFGLRSLGQHIGPTLAAVVSLGAAIGAITTVFTWLNTMVLNPFPSVPAWERLVEVRTRAPGGSDWSASWPDFADWRAGARTVDLAAWDVLQFGLRNGTEPTERAWGVTVSGNYFDVLQVPASLGRVLREDDELRRAPVAVLGHSYWQRRFAGDPGVIGRTITLNGSAFTIVGVAAERFGGTSFGLSLHLYVPLTTMPLLAADGAQLLKDRERRSLEVVGRLKPEATVVQAAGEVDALALRAGAAGGLAHPLGAVLKPYSAVGAPAAMGPVLGALLVVAGLVLLIACANVANLLLARAMARRREIAVRLSIGASRARVVRQLLTESVLLAMLAGGFGLLVTLWARGAMLGLLPAVPYPVGLEFPLDTWVLLFAFGVTAATAVMFGLVPALQGSKPNLVATLKDEIGNGAGGRGRLQAALVVAQVALSLVTLVSAGLFLRSLERYRSVDTGMRDLDQVLLVSTDLQLSGLSDNPEVKLSMVQDLLAKVRALPGVEAASVARSVVLGPSTLPSSKVAVEGYPAQPDENLHVRHNTVSADYFRATGIRLTEGRAISDADVSDNTPVVVVNQAFARRFLAGRSAVGARISFTGDEWLTVVGVVATSKYESYTEDPLPVVFRPYSSRFAPTGFTLHVQAREVPMALTGPIRAAFREVSVELPFLDPLNMAEYTTLPYYPQKVGAIMLAAVGTLALLLAAIGIYATMAYAVSRRVREIGVRVALGATPGHVVRLVLGRSMRATGLGLVIGLAGALAVGQALRSQLLGVSPRDPLTLAGVGVLLALVALVASAVPARRATRVDPMVALRSD
jgi:predicted permease